MFNYWILRAGHSRLTTQLNKKILSIDVLLANQLRTELASMTLTLNLWLYSLKACPCLKLHSKGTRFPPEKGFFSWVAVGTIFSSSNIFFCSWISQKTKLGSCPWQRGILIAAAAAAAVSFLFNLSIGVWVVAELFVCREQGINRVRSREGWKDKRRTYTKGRVERGDIEKNT